MSIEKPEWLRSWLSNLNWDILTWQVYVGDAVENGIDWLLQWVDQAITWGHELYAAVVDLIEELKEIFDAIFKLIFEEAQKLWDSITSWWYDLGEWWATKVTEVKGWIDVATDWLSERVDWIESQLDKLSIAWDNFWEVTLPQLASHLDITKALNAFRLEWVGLFNFWQEFAGQLVEFINDPIEWLWAKFTDWFLGRE